MNIIYFLFNDENPVGQKMYRPFYEMQYERHNYYRYSH
jgi:hypothetical protein